MPFLLPDGRIVGDDQPFTIGEGDTATQIPPGVAKRMSEAEQAAHGIKWVPAEDAEQITQGGRE